jgi:hypothetical protein
LVERSYEAHNKLIADEEKKHLDYGQRLAGLRDNLKLAKDNPTAQAEIVTQLTAAINGQGSGIRINKDNIERTATARSHWQDIQAWAQKFSTDPKNAGSLTPDQLGQMDRILSLVEEKQSERSAAFDEARKTLNEGYSDTAKHRSSWETLQGKLRGINEGRSSGQAAPSSSGGNKEVHWNDLP